ncbi:MAG: DNA polymerase III subunit gamma and tau [Candidatus Nanopelagicales bacterium]
MALALYRTYRPGSLAEVVGQEHVTGPLSRALEAGRIHHAYLLSGPRGCGKTSTARILARSLNCENGPTATPCGRCRSCTELAPNGPGSLDVVELDAATHRGVDDARELREKAIYAPAAARYKIYIIDEAHQLTSEAANALLKLVEEPPAHLRFVFATTEPDKILPTIRSRTFHYGFRLVPVAVLTELLAGICASEGVAAEPTALSLVAKAGAGSARDSLSILGQLLAGCDERGLTYGQAVAALGVTDRAVIDQFVDALAAGDAADMFAVVDRVVGAGHDPRRFLTDVLDRLRDLIVLQADPGAISSGLVEVPDDLADLLTGQSARLGPAQLSRAADLVSAGLTEIRGATAPRLQLELLCARVALPAVDDNVSALLARLEVLERSPRAAVAAEQGVGRPVARETPASPPGAETRLGPPPAGPPPADPVMPASAPASASSAVAGARRTASPGVSSRGSLAGPPARPGQLPAAAASPGPSAEQGQPARRSAPHPAADGRGSPEPAGAGAPLPAAGSAPAPRAPGPAVRPGNRSLNDVRQAWGTILEKLRTASRVAWISFAESRPLSVSEGVLALAIADPGRISYLTNSGHSQRLRLAILDTLGLDLQIEVVLDPGAAQAGEAPGASKATTEEASLDDPDGPDEHVGLELLTRHLGGRAVREIEDK